jgi:hypothetical protein
MLTMSKSLNKPYSFGGGMTLVVELSKDFAFLSLAFYHLCHAASPLWLVIVFEIGSC